MTVIYSPDPANSAQLRGKISPYNSYGGRSFGVAEYGDSNPATGIYQVRPRKSGNINVKMKFYWPTNHQYEPQQTWRGIFGIAISAWQALTEEDKNFYNNRAIGKPMSGYNLFISEALTA
jgi:hypothetical protein